MSLQTTNGTRPNELPIKPTPVIAVAIPLGLGTVIATIALNIKAGPVSFVIPVMLGAGLVMILRRKVALLGLTQDGTVVVAGVVTGLAALFAVTGLQVTADMKQRAEDAQRIVALGRTDPAEQSARLARLDDKMLAELGKVAPALVTQERNRRAAAAEQDKKEKEAALQIANADKVSSLLAELNDVGPGDVDGRIAIYRQLTELAPGRAEYSRALAELTMT